MKNIQITELRIYLGNHRITDIPWLKVTSGNVKSTGLTSVTFSEEFLAAAASMDAIVLAALSLGTFGSTDTNVQVALLRRFSSSVFKASAAAVAVSTLGVATDAAVKETASAEVAP